MRHLGHAKLNLHVTTICDSLGILHCLPGIRKQCLHLFFALYIILPAFITHPVFIGKLLSGLQAQQNIMGSLILPVCIMDIVGGNQFNAQFLAHLHQGRVDRLLLRNAMILQFQEKVSLPETFLVFQCSFLCLIIKSLYNITLYLSCQTGRQGNDSFMVPVQNFHIYTGFIVISFRKATAYNFYQIFIAFVIFRQKYQMIVAILPAGYFLVKTGIRCHINLTPQNGIDSCSLGLFIEINNTVHNTMVGDGTGRHAQFLNTFYIFFDFVGSVQETVLRMDM